MPKHRASVAKMGRPHGTKGEQYQKFLLRHNIYAIDVLLAFEQLIHIDTRAAYRELGKCLAERADLRDRTRRLRRQYVRADDVGLRSILFEEIKGVARDVLALKRRRAAVLESLVGRDALVQLAQEARSGEERAPEGGAATWTDGALGTCFSQVPLLEGQGGIMRRYVGPKPVRPRDSRPRTRKSMKLSWTPPTSDAE